MPTMIPVERRERIQALGYDYAAQPKETLAVCNLCGESAFVGLTHRDRYGYPASAHACLRCGLVFLNPRMNAASYGKFYDGTYRPLVSAFHGRLIDARTIQAEQREYAAERAALLRDFVQPSDHRTLLDIGGSTGVVAHHFMREFGLTATLIDPAPLEVEEARRLGLETVTGLVEEYDFGDKRFDVVILCQTVDHLLDVRGVLARVRQLLTDNGVFFVDIVDFRAAYLRNKGPSGAVKIDHPYYLTELTMEVMLANAGFRIEKKSFAADGLHIGYVCSGGAPTGNARPDPQEVKRYFQELRLVQNARP
jgi:SAM-dependent methyltransferase